MSDDTPTQRFPEQGGAGDAPTQRLEAAEVREELDDEQQKSKGLLIGLIIAGALLLVALLVLVIMLVRASGEPDAGGTPSPGPLTSDTPTPEPTESATPTPEPTESEAPAPPPPSNSPAIATWQVTPATVYCNTQAPNPSNQYLAFNWATSNADRIDIGIVDENGYQLMYANLPPSGTQQSIGQDIIYLCPRAQMVWRLTIFKNGSEVAHQDVTIRNNGDQQ